MLLSPNAYSKVEELEIKIQKLGLHSKSADRLYSFYIGKNHKLSGYLKIKGRARKIPSSMYRGFVNSIINSSTMKQEWHDNKIPNCLQSTHVEVVYNNTHRKIQICENPKNHNRTERIILNWVEYLYQF